MDAKFQTRVQRYGWDKAAPFYEKAWQAQLEPAQTLLLDCALIEPGSNILDVACGTGLVTFRAAALAGQGGRVVGTDISEQMVTKARDRARGIGIANVSFERMDAQDLKLPDGSFDIVLCALGLMYVPDPQKVVAEFHRLLRPGGRAAAAVWGERSKCGWAEIFPIVDARVQSEVCPMFFGLGTGQSLQHAFASAGFHNLRCERLVSTLRYKNADETCEAAFVGGPVALAYDRFPDEVRAEARKEYVASISQYRDGEGYSIPGEFVVVAGSV